MLTYHFGLGNYSTLVMYTGGIVAILLSLFWRPIIGLYYLVPILPLQTIRYRMIDLPLGASMVSLVMLAVVLGLLFRGSFVTVRTPWKALLIVYCSYLTVSLFMGSFYLGKSSPIYFDDSRIADFKDYLLMPILLLCVVGAVKSTTEMKVLVALMCLGCFAVDRGVWGTFSNRDYSSYSDSMRESGVMGQAGSNGLGAFTAQAAVLGLALASAERRLLLRFAYWGLAVFSALCLMYTFSRGGYLAFVAGLIYVGIRKQRMLLAGLVAFGLIWASLVPEAVRERINLTSNGELDHSSETRVDLWEDAISVAGSNLLFGTGVNTYAYMGRLGDYRDTHNIYVKVLVETGIVGLALFIWLLFRTFRIGSHLVRITSDPFFASLGMALSAWLVCSAAANLFGDRWTYLQVNSYLWVLGGLVACALAFEETDPSSDDGELEVEEEQSSGSLSMVGAH